MSITSGFYDSDKGDRRYTAQQISQMFDGLILDGVFVTYGEEFIAKANDTMAITIGTGRCWFDHSWLLNDTEFIVDIDPAENLLNRIDAVVIEIGMGKEIRNNTIKYIKGTPASNPKAPSMIKTAQIKQYPICYIKVNAGTIKITKSDVINKVGSSECPFSAGVENQMDIDQVLSQWIDQVDKLIQQLKDNITDVQDGSAYVFRTGDIMSGALRVPNNDKPFSEMDLREVLNLATLNRWNLERNHPIGDVYISFDRTSPAKKFGGNWESLGQGYVLISAGSSYIAGNQYGSESHRHSVSGIAQFGYTSAPGGPETLNWGERSGGSWRSNTAWTIQHGYLYEESRAMSAGIGVEGSTGNASNRQPSIAVYMWRRIEDVL